MTMVCSDGAGYQCSGDTVIRKDNGVTLTRSGVQAYGKSTQDDLVTGQQTSGLEVGSKASAKADVRVRKSGGTVLSAALLLSDIEITWDGVKERPQIIETFDPTQGRNELASDGRVVNFTLPPSAELDFYDYADLVRSATQAHYANNRYFPRNTALYPLRCQSDDPDCSNAETSGVSNDASDGLNHTYAVREHEDGDIHAGNGKPDASGNPTYLPSDNPGPGVPFPGSKGHREFDNWSYQYGNLTAWLSHDTVEISEWLASTTCGGRACREHNQNRRGIAAFGDVTPPASVPSSGSATYSGFVYGWHAASNEAAETPFRGNAEVTVDFATRAVTMKIEGVPSGSLNVSAVLGAAGSDNANYLTGPVSTATWSGGLSGRIFGSAGSATPPELGGAFQLTGASGAVILGGFIARRQ